MNYYILAIEAVVLVIIFTFMIIVPLCKNPVWWIHDYPKDIQEEYFKTHERIPAAPLSKPCEERFCCITCDCYFNVGRMVSWSPDIQRGICHQLFIMADWKLV